ncbi:MAG: hypothetical protein ACE5ID_05540 [Acidobacteriota bacterium]
MVAWRFERVGGLIYLALALFYILWAWGRFSFSAYLAISGPLALIGLLFLVGARQHNAAH